MRTPFGFASIVWGGLLLRAGVVKPAIGSVDFFRYRRDWNARIAKSFGIRFAVSGPRPGPGTLIVSNHQGFGDVNALCAILPPECKANFISKIEIGELPIFGWHMGVYGDVLFDRKNPDARQAALDDALSRLVQGFSLVLFPEGTRSRDGVPKAEIRPALVAAAIARGFAIQPVGIVGTNNLIEKRWTYPHDADVRVTFGEARRDWVSADAVWSEVKRLWSVSLQAES
jgi:1-acyl-sn-glycerol-3-phosphate acyltransferase